jgi:hypothetical protein
LVGGKEMKVLEKRLSPNSQKHKKQLLAMPVGCEKPRFCHHPLAVVLFNYTCRGSDTFDPDFTKAIKKRQPGWFIKTAEVKKQQILSIPVGGKRPLLSSLYQALNSYKCKGHSSYDPEFAKKIKERQPSWFTHDPAKKKRELLAMPVGCKRPSSRFHPLGQSLANYTCRKSRVYDRVFDAAIRAKHSNWWKPVKEKVKQCLAT